MSAQARAMAAGLAGAAAFVAAAWIFAEPRGFFQDETTQIGGLRLGPLRVVGWLTQGRPKQYFSGIPDRMPPLSYWAGQAWGSVFGLGERSLRLMGLALTAIGVAVTGWTAAWWTGKARAGVAASLLMGLTPILVGEGPDIRAYPLFICLSSIAVAVWARAIRDGDEGLVARLVAMTVALVLDEYTHFFALVLGAALTGSGMVWAWRTGRRWRPWLISGLLLGAAAAGLAPFVLGSVAVTAGLDPTRVATRDPKDLARLVKQMLAPPAISSRVWLVLPAGVGAACIAAGLAGFVREARRASRWPVEAAILLALGIGCGLVVAAGLSSTKVEFFRPTYNLWALPLAALAAAAPLAAGSPLIRWLTIAGFVALIGSHLAAEAAFLRHRAWLDHGADRTISRAIQESGGADRVAVVYEKGAWFSFAAWPVDLRFKSRVPQYLAMGPGVLRRFEGSPEEQSSLEAIDAETIIVAGLGHVSWKQVAGLDPSPMFPAPGPIGRAVADDEHWRLVETVQNVAIGDAGGIWFVGIRLDVYRRAGAAPGGP